MTKESAPEDARTGRELAPEPDDKLRLGGMALRNGLLVHGPSHWAAAVRGRDGELRVASGAVSYTHLTLPTTPYV